jgi:hypothetical protein
MVGTWQVLWEKQKKTIAGCFVLKNGTYAKKNSF